MDGTEMVEVNPVLSAKLKELGLDKENIKKKIAEEGTIANISEIPENVRRVFVCAQDIKPVDHIKMQAAFQEHTDNAVSKTVNFPKEATKNDVREAYILAYKEGCKGVTIYRDGSREEQVLNIGKVNKKTEEQATVTEEMEILGHGCIAVDVEYLVGLHLLPEAQSLVNITLCDQRSIDGTYGNTDHHTVRYSQLS